MTGGHRAFDVLHVATALHLGVRDFLSFDAGQRRLATNTKLKVKPRADIALAMPAPAG
jgi:predicted nucleic acid-binding protein